MLVPHGIVGLAVSVAVMPALFRSSGSAFTAELRAALRLQFAIVLPVSAFLCIAAEPIVTITYARGAFDAQSVELTSAALRGMAFVVPSLAIAALGTRAWTTRARPWIPASASLIALVLNAALDAVLVGPLGLFGLAFATAIVQTLFGIYLLSRARVIHSVLRAAKAAMRVALPSVGIAIMVKLLSLRYLPNGSAALQLVILFMVFFSALAFSIVLLRTREYKQIWSLTRVRKHGHQARRSPERTGI
jgi:peptidoglycan biosynthesis protein MviN/MurJ (putative lipid II flippase)